MFKYLIVNPDLVDRDKVLKKITYPIESIIGTIVAKSRSKALAKTIEITGISNPIVTVYSSLSEPELELADRSKLLWEQPDTKHPVTDANPRGGGKPRNKGIAKTANLALSLSPAGYEFYMNHPNKSRLVSELIDRAAA